MWYGVVLRDKTQRYNGVGPGQKEDHRADRQADRRGQEEDAEESEDLAVGVWRGRESEEEVVFQVVLTSHF